MLLVTKSICHFSGRLVRDQGEMDCACYLNSLNPFSSWAIDFTDNLNENRYWPSRRPCCLMWTNELLCVQYALLKCVDGVCLGSECLYWSSLMNVSLLVLQSHQERATLWLIMTAMLSMQRRICCVGCAISSIYHSEVWLGPSLTVIDYWALYHRNVLI